MQGHAIYTETVTASGAISSQRLVTHLGAQATVAAEKVLGIASFDAADTDLVAVVAKGSAVVEAGGVIAVGDPLTTDAQGRAIKSTAGTDYVFGDARGAAAGAGSTFEALLR